ncbi:O-antigen ligase family protein [Thermodesulfobacteriota bacterium]
MIFAISIPFDKDITKSIGIAMLVFWILEGNFKFKIEALSRSNVAIFFLLFIAYNYISILWSNYPLEAYFYASKYWYYLPFVIIFTSIKKDFIKYALVFFLIGFFVSEIITYGIFFDFWTTSYNQFRKSPSPTAFMSHTIYSSIQAFVALLTLNKAILSKNKPIKSFLFSFYLFIIISLFISGGRTGLVPFVVVQIFMFIFLYKLPLKKILITFTIIVASFSLSYINIDYVKQRTDHGYNDINKIINNDYTSSFGIRIAMFITGLQIANDNILFGVGIKDNLDEMIRYSEQNKKYDFSHLNEYHKWHFHNQYIDILTQLGIIGLFIFLGIFYQVLKLTVADKEMNNIKYIFVFCVLFGIISSDLFHQKHYIYLISLFMGLLLAQNKHENQENALGQ